MVSSKCPQCNREEAFAITTINYQVLELIKHFKSMQAGGSSSGQSLLDDAKVSFQSIRTVKLSNFQGLDEGTCSECTLRSRKLRLCVTCAVKAGVLKHDEKKKEFVLNVENNDIEAALQRAKKIAICGDCALDGVQHEGHKTMQLAVLKNNLEDKVPASVEEKVNQMQKNADQICEELADKFKGTINSLKKYFEHFNLLPATERKIHFNNIEASIEKVNDTMSLTRDAVKRLDILNNEFQDSADVVKNNAKAVTKATTVFVNMDPVLVAGELSFEFSKRSIRRFCRKIKINSIKITNFYFLPDRKQSAREPLLIGLFNPKDNVWTPVGRMPNPKSNYAVASNKSQIFIVGGMNNGSWLQNVEMYDKDKNLRRDVSFKLKFLSSF